MYLIQLLLPLYNNDQQRFPDEMHEQVRGELTEQFEGLTAHTRAPARGVWKEDSSDIIHDDIVIYEVMVPDLDRGWWQEYRVELEERFQQECLVIRAIQFEQI